MRLTGRQRPPVVVSLTPLVDVVLILLIFFMVTSNYLDLDAVPVAQGVPPDASPAEDRPGDAAAAPATVASQLLFVRLGADGRARGPAFDVPASELATVRPSLAHYERAVILPSGAAPLQSLVTVLDGLTAIGIAEVRVVRSGGRP